MKQCELQVGGILLAAGGSSRLGRAKQLLPVNGESLLRRTVRAALNSDLGPLTVVLGAEAGACGADLLNLRVRMTVNSLWRDGLSTSIAAGLRDICQTNPHLDAVVLMVCDQPHLTPETINQLVECHRALGKGMVASHYEGALGVPALFSRKYFGALANLTGDQGARVLLRRSPDDLGLVSFEKGAVDIDTPEDCERLLYLGESMGRPSRDTVFLGS